MLLIESNNIKDIYKELNLKIFTDKDDSFFYRGYQKIATNLSCEVEEFGEFDWTLSDIGYTKLKMGSLVKHYYDSELCGKFLAQVLKAKKAKAASLFFPTIGESKGEHKKDHCIRGIGVNIIKGKIINIHIFYRSSELSRKFFADLVFFNEILWPRLELPRDVSIMFHFVGAYVHSKQFPMFYHTAGCTSLEEIWEDEYMFKMVLKNLENLSIGKCSSYGMIKSTDKFFLSQYSKEEIIDMLFGL